MQKIAIHSVPRSGSTWLGNIFNSHPNVSFKYQPLFSYAFKDYLGSESDLEKINRFFKEIMKSDDDFINQKEGVEKGIIPEQLQTAFNNNPNAFKNYKNLAPSYRKSYLYWLNQAKRETTKQKRITEIIKLCEANIKSRDNW